MALTTFLCDLFIRRETTIIIVFWSHSYRSSRLSNMSGNLSKYDSTRALISLYAAVNAYDITNYIYIKSVHVQVPPGIFATP